MIVLACLALAATCLLWWPPHPSSRTAGWLRGTEPVRRRGPRTDHLPPLLAAGAAGAVAVVSPHALVWLVPGLAATGTVGWLVQQSRAEQARHRAADEVVHACQAVAAQLKVGDVPAQALSTVAADTPLLAPVAATQAIGGDVPAALEALAERPGCHGLTALARSWQLCQVTGAPIADAANRVADGLRADAATERLVAAELAAPRASGRMLAALPALGIGLGFLGGGNPIDFLGRTLIGQTCLAAAICLVCAGLVWTTLLGRTKESEDRR